MDSEDDKEDRIKENLSVLSTKKIKYSGSKVLSSSITVVGWEEKKVSVTRDNEFKAKLRAIVEPKLKDTANNEKNIWEDEDVKKLHTEENTQSC